MADMLRAKNAGNFVDIFEGQDKQGHFIIDLWVKIELI